MATLSISLPDTMKDFIETEVMAGGYDTPSDYVGALIREAQERKAQQEELHRDVRQGFTQIERGETIEHASGQEAADHIIAEGKRRMAERKAAA